MEMNDYNLDEHYANVDAHNEQMRLRFAQSYRHFWLSVFTLGIYALFVRKPERPT